MDMTWSPLPPPSPQTSSLARSQVVGSPRVAERSALDGAARCGGPPNGRGRRWLALLFLACERQITFVGEVDAERVALGQDKARGKGEANRGCKNR